MTGYCLKQFVLKKTVTAIGEMYFMWRQRAEKDFFVDFYTGTTWLGRYSTNGIDGNYYWFYHSIDNSGVWTLRATGTIQTFSDTTHRMELRIKISTTTSGVIQTKIDGITDINNTAVITTDCTGQTTFDKVVFYHSWGCYIDDVVFDNAGWIGNSRIQKIPIIAAGSSAQFTPYPSGASMNYERVNEIPYDDSDYNYINTNDQVDMLDTDTLDESAYTIDAVNAVQLTMRAQRYGVSTPTKAAIGIRSNSTDYFTSDLTVPQDVWTWFSNLWGLDPNGGGAWTKARVNALNIGYKSRA